MKNNKHTLAEKLYQIASLGFYAAAIGFFVAAIIGGNLIYSPIGAAFMCIGIVFLRLSRGVAAQDKEPHPVSSSGAGAQTEGCRSGGTGEAICRIRKWELSDAKDLAAAISDKKVQDNLRDGLPYPYTEQDGTDYISAMLSADENETFAFAVTVDEKAVGSIGAFRRDNIHRQTAELGYYLAEEYWGRGIMTAAVKQICDYVFDNSDIIRIYAEPFAYNNASCRVLEKAGFQYEGTLRSNAVKNGKVIDMKMYSLLKKEE